ncbi:hypothetical protein RhiirB3_451485 [Rhizophagus irregularis]|nr:hypothetical protein RhiirB3_451485 [Rhizophagus irregularis]
MCSSPAINPKLPSSAPSKGHTATLVGNYMIIAFGSFYNGGKFVQSNQIYMIDVSDKNNFKWVKDFTPNRQEMHVIYTPQAKHAINC